MKNKILIAVTLTFTLSTVLLSCNTDLNGLISQVKSADSKKMDSQPLILNMPSINYNQRPENTKIDTIIIHHTAPFASLTRVGYYFQDINTRVSAHYTVGEEGIVIQSVEEKDRAWHAGPSAWLGKYNVNDYSIGIEVLNNGDNKDPFDPLQYHSLINLTGYLMKKYNVPLERVIGHRDIAFPIGRKTDPADNFDWKTFKSRLRSELSLPRNVWGWNENPQEYNAKLSDVIGNLQKDDINIKINAVDTLLTLDYKKSEKQIDSIFQKESSPIVQAKYLRLFEIYENKNHIDYAYKVLDNYKSTTQVLLNQLTSYLYFADKDNAYLKFLEIYNNPDTSKELKITLIKALTNYKKTEISDLLITQLESNVDEDIKKAIVEGLAKHEDKTLNNSLLKVFTNNSNAIKVILADTLRVTFDENVENKMIETLNTSLSKDVLEAVTWALLRKESKKGIEALTKDEVYSKLDDKLKIGLFNAIAKLKVFGYEDLLLSKISQEIDINTKSSLFLALGRLQGEKSFNVLLNSFSDNQVLNMVLLKSLSNYNKKEVNRTITEILENKGYSNNLKIMAISTIKENKLYNLLPILKSAYVETKNQEIDYYANETIKFLEKSN